MSVKEKNGKNMKEGKRNNGVQNLIEVFTNEDESKRAKSGDLLEVVNEEKSEVDTTYEDGQKSVDTNFKQGGNESDAVDRGWREILMRTKMKITRVNSNVIWMKCVMRKVLVKMNALNIMITITKERRWLVKMNALNIMITITNERR